MNRALAVLLVAVTIMALSACNRNDDSPAAGADEAAGGSTQQSETVSTNEGQSSSSLDNSYEGALPPTNQLILGILKLEDTDDAVTGAQAASMLPLWQALQSGTIQNQTERAAILRQIEGTLTDAQIDAIGAMQLTFADLNDWAEANGLELPQFGQGGEGRQGGQGGQGGIFADMSAEERAAFRQEMQNLSPEERQERLQEMGVEVPEGGFQGGGGQGGPGGAGGRFGLLMAPLIELLESKASL